MSVNISHYQIPTDYRAYISAGTNFFSGESEVKRCKLDVEERRISLEEKAQVLNMVNLSIYTPRTARRKIEEIDQRPSLSARTIEVPGQSPTGSDCQYQIPSPLTSCHSPPWRFEEIDGSLDDDENN